MSCLSTAGPLDKTLTTMSQTEAFESFTNWSAAMGVDEVQAVITNNGLIGNFQSRLAIQVASVRTDAPDAWQALGSSSTSGASFTGVIDVSSYTGGAQFMRLGVAYNLSQGSALGQAQTSLQPAWKACGQIVGARTFQAKADEAEEYFEPVTDFVPTLDLAYVKAAIVVSGVSGAFQSRLVYRLAQKVIQTTGAWTPAEASFTTGAGERNTGEIALTPTSDYWIQFGIGYRLTSSGSVGQGTVTASVGVRRS